MKRQNLLSLLLVVFTMSVVACGNTEPAYQPDKIDTEVVMKPRINASKPGYSLAVHYEDEYFMSDAKEYNKNISELSFEIAVITESKNKGEAFFEDLKFNDFEAINYDKVPTIDTVGYFLAHKRVYDFELYAVIFRGFDYQSEWGNNFIIGKTGDHEGFSLKANEALTKLEQYVSNTNKNNRSIKLWIAGYSRGGAIANTLSSLILRNDVFEATKENRLYAYTFEAPNCLDVSNALPYENVHNIVNRNDLVASIPPSLYGLGKCGIIHEIYDENVSRIVRSFDREISIPDFVAISALTGDIKNDDELVAYVIDSVFNNVDSEGKDTSDYTANNREQYTDRYQGGISYLLNLLFKLSSSTLDSMLSDLSGMGYYALLSMFVDDSGVQIKDFLKTYLDRDSIEYNENDLLAASISSRNAAIYLFVIVIGIYVVEDYRPSLTRILNMHYPEVTYALLIESHH